MKEKTIQNAVSCEGIGLHSGKVVHMRLVPASQGKGIVFVRKDRGGLAIPANAKHVIPSNFATILAKDGVTVQTIEHLLAAVSALEVDNLIVELDGPEVPALDGSAYPFVSLLQKAGLVAQKKDRSFIEILKPISISDGGKSISVRPGSSLEVSCQISFNHPVVSKQSYRYWHSRQAFIGELASARTFAFLKDIPHLHAQGLAIGGSLDNAIVIGENEILNDQGLRYSDEFVRHKVLDLVGDFSLLGKPILGTIEAVCSGHKLHAELVIALAKNKEAWKIVTAPVDVLPHVEAFSPSFQGVPVPA